MAERHTNGAAVRELRSAVGIGVEDFASRVGITRQWLTLIESGRRQPRPAVTRSIADELGVPLDAVTYPVAEEIAA